MCGSRSALLLFRIAGMLLAVALLVGGCDQEDAGPEPTPEPSPEATSPAPEPAPESPTAACSAFGSEAELAAQPELPEAVADVRRDVAEAAATCDFDALGAIAGRSQSFTYSFGETGSPARFWRRAERNGEQPMRFLVGVLERPFGTIEDGGSVQYVWPSAFAYGDWKDVPKEDRRALKPLYDEQDLELFAQFGGYIGYRVGISDAGEWLYFVAGD